MEQLLNQGIFEPKATPEQTAALERLETLLALIEGWVQTVVADALGDRIPGTSALSETLRRRRAHRRARRADVRDAGRAGAAAAQAAGGRGAVGAADRRPSAPTPATGSGSTPTCCPAPTDLDEPAAFIDRMVGGDTSGMDEAIDKAIADLQKDEGDSAD